MRPRIDIDVGQTPSNAALLLDCMICKLEMRLVGIESDDSDRDLFTFECSKCGRVETSSARLDRTPQVK
jgi:hypothetical protein